MRRCAARECRGDIGLQAPGYRLQRPITEQARLVLSVSDSLFPVLPNAVCCVAQALGFRTLLLKTSSVEYVGSMKLKTSLTLSEDIVKSVRRAAKKGESRSQTIERLLREGLAGRARHAAGERDLALINEHADRLNAEAEDVLGYQADL